MPVASEPDLWDVAVVGGGPAGATAALAVLAHRPAARVVVVDRADFPRDKPCGDGVAPHALDVLRGLGAPDVAAGYAPVSRLHLGYPAGPAVSGDMARPAHVVPRAVLDARILAAARAAGAEYRRWTVRDLRLPLTGGDEPVVLVGDAGPATPAGTASRAPTGGGSLRARVVVAADGANSTVRRALARRRNSPGHLAVAIRGYAPVRDDLAAEQRIVFGPGDWPAYAWSFPVGDGTANVGYGEVLGDRAPLTRAHLMTRLDALLPGVAVDGERWRAHHLPLSSQRPRQPDGRVLLAGDALSLINPMTGEGIYYAVLSGSVAGAVAAQAVENRGPGCDPGSAYRARLRRELGTHLAHTTVAARLARLPAIVPAALRAADRDPRVFDSLVELGLARGLLTARALAGIGGSVAGRWLTATASPARHGRPRLAGGPPG